jgi:drug/metabolite transporter (DMT)-like permease
MKYIIVLIYVLSFGIADCLWVNVNKKNPLLVSMLGRSMVTTALFFALALFLYVFSAAAVIKFTISDLSLAIGLSIICYGGQYFYVKSLRYSPVSLSITLVSIFTFLISIVISTVVYHEVPGVVAIALMLLTLVGVALIVDEFSWKTLRTYNVGILYIVLASLCWGVGYSFLKYPIEAFGVVNFSLLLEFTILLLNLFLFFVTGLNVGLVSAAFSNSWKYLVALGTLIFLGTVFNSLSYRYFGVATLNIVGKIGIIVPIAYALLFLNEAVNKKQALGIFLVLFGAAAVSYYGKL